jgi:hypothetical protein
MNKTAAKFDQILSNAVKSVISDQSDLYSRTKEDQQIARQNIFTSYIKNQLPDKNINKFVKVHKNLVKKNNLMKFGKAKEVSKNLVALIEEPEPEIMVQLKEK